MLLIHIPGQQFVKFINTVDKKVFYFLIKDDNFNTGGFVVDI